MYALLDGLIEGGVDYVHVSLNDILHARPLGADSRLTVEQILEHVGSRVPVLAAGSLPDACPSQRCAGSWIIAGSNWQGVGNESGMGGTGSRGKR